MKPRPPNILLLIADDQSFHAWRSGNPILRSPATTWLARTGTVFTRAFSPATFCLPSRTSLLTSLFPHQHGWLGNRISIPAPPPRAFLPQELQQAGYETAGFGKWHSPFSPAEAGFSRFDRLGFVGRTPPTQITSAATEYLSRRPAGAPPWFLWLSYVQPHWPWGNLAPDRFSKAYRRRSYPLRPNVLAERVAKPAFLETLETESFLTLSHAGLDPFDPKAVTDRYYGDSSFLEESLAELLRFLGRKILDQTLVLVCSDQGILVGNHRLYLKGAVGYEEMVRIPLLARLPGVFPAGRSDRPATLLDLAPTILGVAGLPVPKDFQGRDLLAPPGSPSGDPFLVIQSARRLSAPLQVRILRTPRWKLILNEEDRDELYDLSADPFELRNRIRLPAEPVPSPLPDLRRKLVGWMEDHGDTTGLKAFG